MCVELVNRNADGCFQTGIDKALWMLVDRGEVEITDQPVLFRLKAASPRDMRKKVSAGVPHSEAQVEMAVHPEVVRAAEAADRAMGSTIRRRKKVTVGTDPAFIEATGELAEALQQGAEQAAAEDAGLPASPLHWGNANKPEPATLEPGFAKIVEKLHVDDPEGTYDRLERELTIGIKRTDYGTVMKHLDRAERNARLAHRLWQDASVAFKRWELDSEVTWAAMRSQANRSLQSEKDKGLRSKMITDADVESRLATIFPDEWRAQQHERNRNKALVASMENLAEMWSSRCRSLQTILSKQR
jgi:hypothetical protein